MWENETRNTLIRNILIFVVFIAVSVLLYMGISKAKERLSEENAVLREANSSQRQEQNNAKQETIDLIEQAYATDMATVAQYLPGIVCWGDSLTAGSSGNMSYPYMLQRYIDVYQCGMYYFRNYLDESLLSARVDWDSYTLSIPVINMGAGQENTETLLGRTGVEPFVVSTGFTIPAGTESVTIQFTAPDGVKVTPLTAGDNGINPVTIAGVEGTLSLVSGSTGWTQSTYEFTRSEPGKATSVSKGTRIIPACTKEYTNYFHIIWTGTYDSNVTPEALVSKVNKLLSRCTGESGRYLVIGPCTVNGSWTTDTYTLEAVDSAMLQAFGSNYVNVRKYLIEDGLQDAGLGNAYGSQQNQVPDAFRCNTGSADLNGTAYKLIGKLVYERMDRLGYFAEIQQELCLDKATQAVLQSSPTYFTKQLNAG